MTYVPLHIHSEYSNIRFLDSTNKIPDIIDKAVEYGCKGCALTDHESLSGHIKFMNYIKAGKENGSIPKDFKPILGDEIYLIDDLDEVKNNYRKGITKYYHFIILAKDKEGHRQLRKISSQAWANRFVRFNMERVPVTKKQVEEIIGDNKGHLIFSTACLGSEFADIILKDKFNEMMPFITWCQNTALPENFYFEMQPNDSDEQVKVDQVAVKLSHQFGIKTIITTDAHYLTKDLAPIHSAFLRSRGNDDRETDKFYKTCYIMNDAEIHEILDSIIGKEEVDTALKNTVDIADKIEEYDLAHNQVVPKVPIPDFQITHLFKEYYDEFPYLKKFAYSDNKTDRYYLYLVERGWKEKEWYEGIPKETVKKMVSRINDELEAIWESSEKIGDKISNYYITYLSIKDMVWDDGPNGGDSLVGVGRGSVASFYTCYLIGVHDVNSFKENIPYWRHLHKDRPEMPDVDFDSETRRRGRILDATKKKFGYNHVLNICTFKTEGPKLALLTVCRGLGISNDESAYLASLIPSKRGFTTPLSVMVNGNEEEGIKPDKEFINECNQYPHLLDYALQIEGIVSGRSIHASGLIIFEDEYTELNCMMTAPNGQPTTQWDMNDSTYCGGLKFDYLTVTNLDVMHVCLSLLVENGYITWQGNLRNTFEKYFGTKALDYDSPKMWEMAWNRKILNLFQFDTAVGRETIKEVKPTNLHELGVCNALMRLMPQEGDTTTPTERYIAYKNDLSKWYAVMRNKYHLTEDEIHVVEKYLKPVYGVSTMQEEVMEMAMDPKISNFTMTEANKLRKSIAKKSKKLQNQAKILFYDKGKKNNTRINMLDYVWNEVVKNQLSYSFSLPHLISYSIIAIQEMNMAFRYPIVFWNCANLIVNSGSDEGVDKGIDYGKTSIAIGSMAREGIKITPPKINECFYGFKPEADKNRIIFGLKAIKNINDETARFIINNRPYDSLDDFLTRIYDTKNVTVSQMVSLIKAQCFSSHPADDMTYFLRTRLFTPVTKLTLAQIKRVSESGIVSKDNPHYIEYRMINFKKYVLDMSHFVRNIINKDKVPKCGYNDRLFVLDSASQPFFKQYFGEDSVKEVQGEYYVISEKLFSKEIDSRYIKPFVVYLNQKETINAYNNYLWNELWEKYAHGSKEHWAMEALSYYPDEHELSCVDLSKYGVVDYYEQPKEPDVYDHYYRWTKDEGKSVQKPFPKYKIQRIAGTVVDFNATHYTVTLQTPTGIVNCKLGKGEYLFYNRTLSVINEGKKSVIEQGWFKRGTCLLIAGYRKEDVWVAKTYADSIYKHTVNRITDIKDNELIVQQERTEI